MMDRLTVPKTYKLFIAGTFPRSESGRSLPIKDDAGDVIAHLCRASRKDLRMAVEAARKAQPAWQDATAYLRGQILYRMAEMLEGKKGELAEALGGAGGLKNGKTPHPGPLPQGEREEGTPHPSPLPQGEREEGTPHPGPLPQGEREEGTPHPSPLPQGEREREVEAAIDRLISYAGWADKYQQVLGCNNPISGPYYNFTIPEPTGVVGVVAPDECPLLGLVSLIAPVLCAGSTVVAIASEANPIPAAVLGEVCATSDVPGGVVNILTGFRDELLPHLAQHRDVDAIHAAGVSDEHRTLLRQGAADNVKRVTVRENVDWFDAQACQSPWWVEAFVEMKTVWHPSGT